MTRTFLEMLPRLGVEYQLVDRRFSRSIEEIGVPSGRKLMRAVALAAKLARIADPKRFSAVIYFVATNLAALAVDAVMLRILRARKLPCWLYLHGRGFTQVAGRGHAAARAVEIAMTSAAGGIVLSERLIPDVEKWIPRNRLFVIPNAIPDIGVPERHKAESEAACRFLYLSNLVPSKGALEFAEAAVLVGRDNPGCSYKVFGVAQDARFAARIDEQALKLGGALVRGSGIYGDEKRHTLFESDVFVFPTYYEFEAFPLVCLEAMSAGLPVIATDVGGIPDIVVDEVTGYIVPPRDIQALALAMRRFACSAQMREKMGAAGRARFLECFTLEAYDAAWREALPCIVRASRH